MNSTQRGTLTKRARTSRAIALTLSITGLVASGAAVTSAGAAAKKTEISTASSATLGTYLVSGGRTLYTLNSKKCDAACLKAWPAVTLAAGTTKAVAGAGVSAAKLGRVKDSAGKWQVTYGGKALYRFIGDTSAGQVSGNKLTDQWGLWLVDVTKKPKSGSSGGTGGGTTTTKPPTTTTTKPPTTTTNPPTTTTAPSGGGVSY
jgi:predicted lipoprotein with Yx(FWY)xxD motif